MNSPADFCILVHWRSDNNKAFRDYYFSPSAIKACGRLLFDQSLQFCEPPLEKQCDLVVGCASFLPLNTK